jgi:hypothetical protein
MICWKNLKQKILWHCPFRAVNLREPDTRFLTSSFFHKSVSSGPLIFNSGFSNFYERLGRYSKVKVSPWSQRHGDKWEKNFRQKVFFIFYWDAAGLLFTLMGFFTYCSLWDVGKPTMLQLFHCQCKWQHQKIIINDSSNKLSLVLLLLALNYCWCHSYQWFIIAGVIVTGKKLITDVMESIEIQDKA